MTVTQHEALTLLVQRVGRVLASLPQLGRRQKQALALTGDALLCFVAVFIAFALRVGVLAYPIGPQLIFAAVCVPLFIPIFFAGNVYSTIFRFVGARSIFQLARAIALYSIPLIIVFMLIGVPKVPRTIAILQPVMFFGLAATMRIAARSILMDLAASEGFAGATRRVLIYGVGPSGKQLAMALRHDPRYALAAFVDDDELLGGQQLDGVRIYHSSQMAKVIKRWNIGLVLLALPHISRRRRHEIVGELRDFQVHVQILPDLQELVAGNISTTDLREVQIEDLLGRDPVQPNQLLLGRTVVGKTVLVTGAGGSIGSELCRQIVTVGPRCLVLYERAEFSLYRIERELREWCAANDRDDLEIVPLLGSVSDEARLNFVFSEWKPETVFHAAAYKHVTLVEGNPIEAIRNNVIGTHELVKAAKQAEVSDFIQISTDKAVRPTNVMGATKRAAEQIVQAYAASRCKTRFSIVRFGNVLGSSGSVVPLFRRQIEFGGPITLTHREVTRYFMTIPEAAQLVLQAAGLAHGGEVFVLDMGEPVKIASLARAMVELSGLTVRTPENPDGDIEVVEVGLRPGEKLCEELLIGGDPQPTRHERIMMAREDHLTVGEIERVIEILAATRDRTIALRHLQVLVPGFAHRRDDLLAQNDRCQANATLPTSPGGIRMRQLGRSL